MARLADDLQIACVPDVLVRVLDGESVLLDLASGSYYGLDEIGTRVFRLVSEGKALGEVRAALLDEFEVGEAELARDVDDLLFALRERGLVRFEVGAAPPSR